MGVFFVLTHGVEEKGRLSGFGRRCRGTGEREEEVREKRGKWRKLRERRWKWRKVRERGGNGGGREGGRE